MLNIVRSARVSGAEPGHHENHFAHLHEACHTTRRRTLPNRPVTMTYGGGPAVTLAHPDGLPWQLGREEL